MGVSPINQINIFLDELGNNMDFLDNIIPILTFVGIAIVVIFAILITIGKFYRKVEQGQALIINKMKNEPDVTTTGGSSLKAVNVLRNLGYTVDTVLSIVDRKEGATEGFLMNGIKLKSLFTIDDFDENE